MLLLLLSSAFFAIVAVFFLSVGWYSFWTVRQYGRSSIHGNSNRDSSAAGRVTQDRFALGLNKSSNRSAVLGASPCNSAALKRNTLLCVIVACSIFWICAGLVWLDSMSSGQLVSRTICSVDMCAQLRAYQQAQYREMIVSGKQRTIDSIWINKPQSRVNGNGKQGNENKLFAQDEEDYEEYQVWDPKNVASLPLSKKQMWDKESLQNFVSVLLDVLVERETTLRSVVDLRDLYLVLYQKTCVLINKTQRELHWIIQQKSGDTPHKDIGGVGGGYTPLISALRALQEENKRDMESLERFESKNKYLADFPISTPEKDAFAVKKRVEKRIAQVSTEHKKQRNGQKKKKKKKKKKGAAAERERPIKAVVVWLACQRYSKRFPEFVEALKMFQKNFNERYRYPMAIFHEGDYSEEDKEYLRSLSSAKVEFFPVTLNQVPKIYEHIAHAGKHLVSGHTSYKNMCRFFSGEFFWHEALQKYEYYWRMDSDSFLLKPIHYDVFERLAKGGYSYGWLYMQVDLPQVVTNLGTTVQHFLKKHPDIVPKSNMDSLFDNITLKYNGNAYYNNFEVSSFDMWRTDQYKAFYQHLEDAEGFWKYRWGDSPVHTFAVYIFLDVKSQVYRFPPQDIFYKHPISFHALSPSAQVG